MVILQLTCLGFETGTYTFRTIPLARFVEFGLIIYAPNPLRRTGQIPSF